MVVFLFSALLVNSFWGGSELIGRQANEVPNNCEVNVSLLHNADASVKKGEVLIIVARLGNREKARSLNFRRLHNVKTYLVRFLGREEESIVVAEGPSIDESGCVEVYVAGKLFGRINVKSGGDVRVGSCDNTSPGDSMFYGAIPRKNKR